MGGWKLEVFKMGMYMAFPVAMFYYFNQPKYFEEWVTNIKSEMYPPIDPKSKELIDNAIREHQLKEDEKQLRALGAL